MSRASLHPLLCQLRQLVHAHDQDVRSDAQLLQAFIREHDEQAFTTLLHRHGTMVYNTCRRLLPQTQDVEDVFQATFLVLLRNPRSIRKQPSLSCWLHGVAYRLALKARMQQKRAADESKTVESSSQKTPLEEMTFREVRSVLDDELHQLSARYQAPLVLCYLEGLTQDEAAGQLGWSKSTLRRRLERGRALLRTRLTRRGVTLSAAMLPVMLSEANAATVPMRFVLSTAKATMLHVNSAGAVAISTKAATLAQAALPAASTAKAKLAALLLLLLAGLTLAGVGMLASGNGTEPVSEKKQKTQVADKREKKEETARVDRYGDPLPAGVIARLGTVRLRHGNAADLAFSSDGKSLVSCGADRAIRFWDIKTGRLLREQQFSTRPFVRSMVLSPDGNFLAFHNGDLLDALETFYLWDVKRNRLRYKLPLDERWTHQAIFTPDSKTLVTATYQRRGVLKMWDVQTGKHRTLGKHTAFIGLSVSNNGKLLTADGIHHSFILWDLVHHRKEIERPLPDNVAHAVISPDGRTLASWSWHNKGQDKGVQFWDGRTGKAAKGWVAPKMKAISQIQFSPDGKTVFITTENGVLVWDPIAGRKIRTLPGRRSNNVTFSPDGKTVAALNNGDVYYPRGTMLRLWDLTTGAPHATNSTKQGHLDDVDAVAFAPDGQTVASSSREDGSVRLWDTRTGRLKRTILVNDLGLRDLTFSPDGKYVFTGTTPGIIKLEVATGRQVARYVPSGKNGKNRHYMLVMHLSDDGRILHAISQNYERQNRFELHTWEAATGKHVHTVPLATAGFYTPYSRFSGDGHLLAIPSGSICGASTGEERLHLRLDGKHLANPVAFSRDGALIAFGVWQKITRPGIQGQEMIGIQIWEVATASKVAYLPTGELADFAFTPDGRRLLTAGPKSLKLWNLATCREEMRLPAHFRFRGSFGASFTSSMALSPDGHTVATGLPDTTVLLWSLKPKAKGGPARPLSEAQLQACWTDLAGADAARAQKAIFRLADAQDQAVKFLRDRIHPAKAPPAAELKQLIADLDSRQFKRRIAATKRLTELAGMAEAAMRKTLRQPPSLEVHQRLQLILAQMHLVKSAQARRDLRAIRVLEAAGTPMARQVLRHLSKGAPKARFTRRAHAAVQRLQGDTSAR